MKKSIKKQIVFLTVITVLAAAVTACSGKDAQPAGDQSATVATENTDTPAASDAETEAAPETKTETETDGPASEIDPDNPENETDEEYYGPDDFVQEQSGKLEFKDYDEVISCLTSGQGWAKFKLIGADYEVLAVTEKVEDDGTASSASLYGLKYGYPMELSYAGCNDPKYPLRCADGLLYCGDEHTYETDIISAETGGLMVKDLVSEGTGDDAGTYTGFLRPNNDFGNDKDFTGGKEEFESMMKERDAAPVVKFTKIP